MEPRSVRRVFDACIVDSHALVWSRWTVEHARERLLSTSAEHYPAYSGCFDDDGSYSEQCERYLSQRADWEAYLPWVPDMIP